MVGIGPCADTVGAVARQTRTAPTAARRVRIASEVAHIGEIHARDDHGRRALPETRLAS